MRSKHCFLLLASAGVSAQIFMLGLAILLIFGWTSDKIFTLCSNSDINLSLIPSKRTNFAW